MWDLWRDACGRITRNRCAWSHDCAAVNMNRNVAIYEVEIKKRAVGNAALRLEL